MTSHPMNVSVTAPVGQAIDRVKEMLFRPFDPAKWFVIGFCAWLAQLGSSGFNGNFGGSNRHDGGSAAEWARHVWEYVVANLAWIIPLAATILLFVIALSLLFVWLSSRGRFMFLHCVALNRAEIQIPWNRFAAQGNSLFLFRVVLGLIGLLPVLTLLTVIGVAIWRMVEQHGPTAGALAVAIAAGFGLIAIILLFVVIEKLTEDFVVPIMFRQGLRIREGWRVLFGLLRAHSGDFVVYLLFQVVLSVVVGLALLMIILITCCIAGCLMAIPYLGTVLLLPLFVFWRAYSIYYLAQYGPEFNVFPPPVEPTPPATPTASVA